MDYLTLFKEKDIDSNPLYSRDDIGVARLFYDVHRDCVRYVVEAKAWYIFTGQRWQKDGGGLQIMELCKAFVQAYAVHAETLCGDDAEDSGGAEFVKYANKLKSRHRREGILNDAKSIEPVSLSAFDTDSFLFNCTNGTLNLQSFTLQPHRAGDFITKLSRVKYSRAAKCPRWDRFVDEIMCGDKDTALFLQKALGYALTGDTSMECFFILYGSTTRNGKSTLTETVAYLMGDYAMTVQPQTLSRRPSSGAAASPDMARLKGARLVNMPEPEKDLELNVALVKQLTGGDTYTGRSLNENPVEFRPEFKLYINTNHLPRTADDTMFKSGRVKLIPFERHFAAAEQDTGLKKHFRKPANRSAILNWLAEGYRWLLNTKMATPPRVEAAIAVYRDQSDIFGDFLAEHTEDCDGARTSTSEMYAVYTAWAKGNRYRPMNNKNFVGDLRKRYDVRRTGSVGNMVVGLLLLHRDNPPKKSERVKTADTPSPDVTA